MNANNLNLKQQKVNSTDPNPAPKSVDIVGSSVRPLHQKSEELPYLDDGCSVKSGSHNHIEEANAVAKLQYQNGTNEPRKDENDVNDQIDSGQITDPKTHDS